MIARLQTLNQIDRLIEDNCHSCENRIQRGGFSKADKHCARECPIGAKLQELGRELEAQTKAKRAG